MVEAVADCLVSGHEPLIEGLHLRDPDDRHVLAAAIKSGAQVIVTADKDFTVEDLAPWNIEAKHPDDFVLDQIDINDRMVWACVQQIANSHQNPPETVEDVLGSWSGPLVRVRGRTAESPTSHSGRSGVVTYLTRPAQLIA